MSTSRGARGLHRSLLIERLLADIETLELLLDDAPDGIERFYQDWTFPSAPDLC
jgi:hypothetical protein